MYLALYVVYAVLTKSNAWLCQVLVCRHVAPPSGCITMSSNHSSCFNSAYSIISSLFSIDGMILTLIFLAYNAGSMFHLYFNGPWLACWLLLVIPQNWSHKLGMLLFMAFDRNYHCIACEYVSTQQRIELSPQPLLAVIVFTGLQPYMVQNWKDIDAGWNRDGRTAKMSIMGALTL